MKRKTGKILMAVGCLLLAGAACLTGWNLLEARNAEQFSQQAVAALQEIIPERSSTPPVNGASSAEDVQTAAAEVQTVTIDGREYIGILSIPDLGLSLPVCSSWSYKLLRTAPCCYSGSAAGGDLVIAGHNYSRHFGLLHLLQAGDEVLFTDTEGSVYRYAVSELETLGPTETENMVSGSWDLTLFTCTPGGASRVTVRCKRVL